MNLVVCSLASNPATEPSGLFTRLTNSENFGKWHTAGTAFSVAKAGS